MERSPSRRSSERVFLWSFSALKRKDKYYFFFAISPARLWEKVRFRAK